MWYIIDNDGDRIELELGSLDILDYAGQTIHCESEEGFADGTHVVDDAFLLTYDWFEDMDDYDKIDAYRRAMYGQWQHAIDNWQDAYVGEFDSEADFSECMHEDYLAGVPNHIKSHIDWQGVWDSTDRHSYFESDGFYFQNL